MTRVPAKALHFVLLTLVSFGLWSALTVSYKTITGIAPCPSILNYPVCYAVSLGYCLMFIGQIGGLKQVYNKLFFGGWGLVIVIACIGVGLELMSGDVCPKTSAGIPLCYVSFMFCIVILSLKLVLNRAKKA